MKKFFITLLILIILGTAAFFLGWAQLTVPPGSYGVIHSKIHGVDPQLVKSGEFRWVWQKLLPTNVKIAVFKLDNAKIPVDFYSSLPSGDVYASFVNLGSVDFSWELKGEISLSLKPESLVSISEKNNIMEQQELDLYVTELARKIKTIILLTFSSSAMNSQRLETILSGNPDTQMELEIKKQFPEINDFSFTIQQAKIPDFILYNQLRLIYEEYLEKQRDYISTAFGKRAENYIDTRLHFNELEKMGELITKYPLLLNYIELEKSQNR